MNILHTIQTQINFIAETDKLKGILRKTSPININRKENSAEHSWQIILSAIIFVEHSNQDINLLKVLKMLAIHDIVEIDVGDIFHYDKENTPNLFEKELKAAERIFGMLDSPQKEEYINLWIEFEKKETPEAKYATAIDRLIAIILNFKNNGGIWPENNITVQKILEKNAHIADGAINLWEIAKYILDECSKNGFIKAQ